MPSWKIILTTLDGGYKHQRDRCHSSLLAAAMVRCRDPSDSGRGRRRSRRRRLLCRRCQQLGLSVGENPGQRINSLKDPFLRKRLLPGRAETRATDGIGNTMPQAGLGRAATWREVERVPRHCEGPSKDYSITIRL